MMLLWFFSLISFGLGQGSGGAGDANMANDVAASSLSQSVYVAEPQTPTGKFTTAVEVKPILNMTKANWVAVREYDGRDLVYFTHLMAWRCGLVAVKYSINGGEMAAYDLPPCQVDTATPNALPADFLPFIYQPLKSVETVQIELIFDDLTEETESYERKAVLIP